MPCERGDEGIGGASRRSQSRHQLGSLLIRTQTEPDAPCCAATAATPLVALRSLTAAVTGGLVIPKSIQAPLLFSERPAPRAASMPLDEVLSWPSCKGSNPLGGCAIEYISETLPWNQALTITVNVLVFRSIQVVVDQLHREKSAMEAAIVRTSAARSSQCFDLLIWSEDI